MAESGNGVKIGGATYPETYGVQTDYGEMVYKDADTKWYLTDIGTASKCRGLVGICPVAGGVEADGTGRIQTEGPITNTAWNWTMGSPIYLGTTPGSLTQSKPGAGTVRVVGVPLDPNTIYLVQAQFLDTASGGTGDVVGPAAATDNAIARYDGVSGKAVQNGVVTVSDSGIVNTPSGGAYQINGAQHPHAGEDISSGTIPAARLPVPGAGTKGGVALPASPSGTYYKDDGTWGTPPGGGDVAAPGATVSDNAVVRMNGTSGTAIQGSQVTIDDNGSVNIPSGETYDINGSPHAHSQYEASANKNTANGYCGLDAGGKVAMAQLPANLRAIALGVLIDGGGSAITAGTKKAWVIVPCACTITGWTVVGDQSGSIVVDVNRSTYAGFPTTASIAGTEKPTLSSAQKNQDLALATWTTSLAAGDVLEFDVDSAATVTRVAVTIFATRT